MNSSGELYELTTTEATNENASRFHYKCFIENVTDPNPENLFRFIINGVLVILVALFGMFGNIISMIILSRPQMKSSINYLLIGLARCDAVLLLTSVLLFGLPGIYPYTGYLFDYYYYIYPKISPYVYPFAMIAQTVSVYLTLTVTLERFVAVCHPLRARSLCTYGRARLYVIVIIIFSILYNLPHFWEVDVSEETFLLESENVTIYCVTSTSIRNEPLYIKIYIHWMYLIFLYFLPFTPLAILNACIYKQVRKANKERLRLSTKKRQEIGLATMLLCVVVVFFLCNILALVTNTMEAFFPDDEFEYMVYFVETSNLLISINSSVNFIIYVIFGEKFKRIFLKLFCTYRFLPGRESPEMGTRDDSIISNGDRNSLRLHRQNTACSRNGGSFRVNGLDRGRSMRVSRAPSPGPIVYYPRSSKCTYTTTLTTPEWEVNGRGTVDF